MYSAATNSCPLPSKAALANLYQYKTWYIHKFRKYKIIDIITSSIQSLKKSSAL